ncbi:hypothetical protein TNCV_4303541 [Trichonephila clavipes]|nr:hypothetical protein TNCV_4303541 [Trichonephila clavipes]
MVEVKPINISLNQHSPSLSVGTAISPTLTEEFIIHPSVYSEIEKLGHAKSDVLLSENSPLVSMEVPLRTAYGQNGRCDMQPKAKHSLRAQAQLIRTETVETFELVKEKPKLLREKQRRRTREVREQALPSEYHRQTYL